MGLMGMFVSVKTVTVARIANTRRNHVTQTPVKTVVSATTYPGSICATARQVTSVTRAISPSFPPDTATPPRARSTRIIARLVSLVTRARAL